MNCCQRLIWNKRYLEYGITKRDFFNQLSTEPNLMSELNCYLLLHCDCLISSSLSALRLISFANNLFWNISLISNYYTNRSEKKLVRFWWLTRTEFLCNSSYLLAIYLQSGYNGSNFLENSSETEFKVGVHYKAFMKALWVTNDSSLLSYSSNDRVMNSRFCSWIGSDANLNAILLL